jgi:hypothetical protein
MVMVEMVVQVVVVLQQMVVVQMVEVEQLVKDMLEVTLLTVVRPDGMVAVAVVLVLVHPMHQQQVQLLQEVQV